MADILISGYYGFSNIGDDAILRTVIEHTRATIPDSRITVLSNSPEETAEKYGVEAQPRMRFFKIIKAVRSSDIVISGGGSLLQDVTSRVSILYYLFIIILAAIFKKRIFVYSQGIGPIRRRFNRKLTAFALKRADLIAVRDEQSARFLEQIGVPPERVNITADPVLRLQPADLTRGREILQGIGLEKTPGRRIVGWAVKSDPSAPGFFNEFEEAIRRVARDENTDCVLIPFHYEQDLHAIEELSARLGDSVYTVTDKHLSDDMLSVIGNLDLLVGVRLHSLIYAAVMGVPCIGISYDPKIDAFLESVGQEPLSTTAEFSADRFEERYRGVSDLSDLTPDREKVEGLIKLLDRNDEMLYEIVTRAPEKKKKSGAGGIIGFVMLVTVLARMFGILRESIQANVFGAADAFYAAYNKTIYIFTTVAYAMCVAAVPIMTKAFAKDRKHGERSSNALITLTLLFSIVGGAVWAILTLIPGANGFLWGAADGEILTFIRIMAASMPIIVTAYMMVALMQSMDHYALQGSMSLPYSFLLIGYLLIFGSKLPLTAYVAVVSLGWILQFAMCLPYVVKERYRFRPTLNFKGVDMSSFLKTGIVTVVTNSMYLFCYLLDANRAAGLGEGITSAFYYADKLFTPLTTTFIYSISAVMFPRMNREYTKASRRDYLKYVWQFLSNTLVIVFPICVLLIVFGAPILKVLFESGNFSAENTAATASIFTMYALGMAGFSSIDILSKAFFAMDKRAVPLAVSLGIIASNFALNMVFGFSGALLALTTAVSLTVGAIITVIILFHGEKIVNVADILKSIVASAAMGGAAWGLKLLLVSQSDGKLMLIAKCGAVGIVSLAVFVAVAWLLKLDALKSAIKKRMKKA